MELNHLTDFEIQDLLDGNRLRNEHQVQQHLEECGSCRGALEQYELLYAELKQPAEVALRPDFAAHMAEQFEVAYARSQKTSLLERLIWSGVGLAAAVAIYFFVDLSSVAQIFEGFDLWKSAFSGEQLMAWANLLQEYQIDPSVLAMAALALLLFGNMDAIIRHFRDRHPMCM